MATVYNTLNLMKKNGMIREIAVPGVDYKRYDANMRAHAHIICNDCGKIIDIENTFNIEIDHEQRKGFEIVSSELNFYGMCPNCSMKRNSKYDDTREVANNM